MNQIKKIKIIYCPEYTGFISSPFLNTQKMPPTGIAQLTAYLREKGFEVDQDDLNIKVHYDNYHLQENLDLSITSDIDRVVNYLKGGHDPELKELTDKILNKTTIESYDIIGLSASYQDNLSPMLLALLIAKHIKQKSNVPIVVGGSIYWLSSSFIHDLFKLGHNLGILDYLVKQWGILTFYKLISKLNNNDNLDNIPGLVYIKNDKLLEQGFGEFIFQKPDFEGLPLELYRWQFPGISNILFKIKNKKILTLPYEFIYGCPNHCIFCGNSSCNHLDYLSPQKIVVDLKELSKKYKTKYFFFLSNTINISKQFINQLCDEIIKQKLNIYWSDCARFNNMDRETLEKMRKAGCIRLIYGFDTGSPRMLKYIQKNITLENASEVLRLTDQAGIWVGLELIAGMPTEREEDIDETIKFIEENQEYIDNIYLGPYHIVEGSLLKSQPENFGITNLREINEFMSYNTIAYNKVSQPFSYDEINGLKWEDKKKQITHSCIKITKAILPIKLDYYYDKLQFLFLMYNSFKDKKKIREKYEKFFNHLSILETPPHTFIEKVRKRFYRIIYQKDPTKLAI